MGMTKETFYEKMDSLANKYGIAVEYSENNRHGMTEPTLRLVTEAVGPRGTRFMVEQFKSYDTGRLNHYVWVTNNTIPGRWEPITQKHALYVLQGIGEGMEEW